MMNERISRNRNMRKATMSLSHKNSVKLATNTHSLPKSFIIQPFEFRKFEPTQKQVDQRYKIPIKVKKRSRRETRQNLAKGSFLSAKEISFNQTYMSQSLVLNPKYHTVKDNFLNYEEYLLSKRKSDQQRRLAILTQIVEQNTKREKSKMNISSKKKIHYINI